MNMQEAIKICNNKGYEILCFMRKSSGKITEQTQITGVLVSVDENTNKKISVDELIKLSLVDNK